MKMNSIDGKTVGITSPKDRSGLNERWIGLNEEQLNGVEAEFIFEAQKKYLLREIPNPSAWFNLQFLFKVHKDMFSPVWEWAGNIRKSEKNIGVKAYLIQMQLENLCRDVNHWNSEPVEFTFLEQACTIHYRLAFIHPFEDGNGRFSRLIADRYLKANKCSHTIWPDNLHKDIEPRNNYIQALREADQGDIDPLIAFAQTYGAKDPTINEILENPFYQKRLHGDKLHMMLKALLRRAAKPNGTSRK